MSDLENSDRFPRHSPELVSVVIPVRNGADLLPVQLEALTRQTYEHDWELIVVDNGSTDDTARVAVSWSDRLPIRVVPANDKQGVNYARNVGIRSARGELIIFCDADDEVSEQWLSALVEASLSASAVGGAIDSSLFDDPTKSSWYSVRSTSRLRLAGGFLPAAATCNLAVWDDVLTSLGGFNEDYGYGATDVEFCWRLQLAGYDLAFAPQALVHYRTRSDLRSLARQFYHYGRGDARLFRDFRAAGMPRSSLKGAVKGWAWLVIHVPDLLRDPSYRGNWIRRATMRLGKVAGSIENRTVYL